MPSFTELRKHMVEVIKDYGVKDKKVLDAMLKVPRHEFVQKDMHEHAYSDCPLPIGSGQTISQPYTVAMMLEHLELKEGNNVLEVGCGSGYNAAVIKEIVKTGSVTSIEVVEELVNFAKKNLERYCRDHCIGIVLGDGSEGYEKNAPYDKVIFTCACPAIPTAVVKQLKEGGIIVAPVGASYFQEMIKAVKRKGRLEIKTLGQFRFVPLIGKFGFKE